MKVFAPLLCVALAACATFRPVSPAVAEQFKAVGLGYGVVVRTEPADNSSDRRSCADGKTSPSFSKFCGRLDQFKIVTVNVAATTGKSFLKNGLVVPKETDIQPGDIVKFRFLDADGFVKLASRGETPTCRWAGSPALMIGFPFQEGGVECEGWSYKQVLHIDWLKG